MTPERWRLVKEIFSTALEHDTADRPALVAARCGADVELHHEVESLLAADQAVEQGFWSPALSPTAATPGEADANDHFTGANDRFTIEAKLGEGGFGIVYRALDRRLQQRVALKLLRTLDADMLVRFKREFRAIAALRHPNLVRCHELFAGEGSPFFTMELIDGLPLLEHLGAEVDDPSRRRLVAVFQQVTAGLTTLHAAGWLHRDLKPSNVLVGRDGRAVILDLGLARDLFRREGGQPSLRLFGTPHYMAPECFQREIAGEASDWYSVGVMLYEALTGVLPQSGDLRDLINAVPRAAPVPPSQLAADVPPHIEALCLDLLHPDPAQRPPGTEVLRRLTGAGNPLRGAPGRPRPAPVPFIGRAAHLAALREAFAECGRGHSVVLEVSGPSGIGKTALVHRFLHSVSQDLAPHAVVLEGRCYERESIAYKVLDGVVDALAQHLLSLPAARAESLLPRHVHELTQLFPALTRVGAVANARRRVFESRDGLELRRRAGGALRELLGRLAHDAPVVIFVDDLQWGDLDSAALLRHLLGPPDTPPLLFVAVWRTEFAQHPTLLDLRAALASDPPAHRELVVPALAPSETRELAGLLLGPEHPSVPAVADEAAGIPYFVDALAGYARAGSAGQAGTGAGALRLDDVLRGRIGELPGPARRLLEIVSLAGKPIERTVAFAAAGLDVQAADFEDALLEGHLVRPGVAGASLEPYHDRIREVVVGALPRGEYAVLHHRLVAALVRSDGADPEDLALHAKAAGDLPRAAQFAEQAAERAMANAAFDRAARLFAMALELMGPADAERGRLLARLGDAQANAGRGRQAAESYLAAADVDLGNAEDLRHRAADQLLRSGDTEQGVVMLKKLLAALGWRVADSLPAMLVSMLLRQARLGMRGLDYRPRREGDVPRDTLRRVDLSWSAFVGLSMVDPVGASYVQSQHILYALRSREPARVARALAMEATFAVAPGSRRLKRYQRIDAALQRSVAAEPSPLIKGLVGMAKSGAAYFLARFPECVQEGDAAESILRDQCVGTHWEVGTTSGFVLGALVFMGELAEIARRFPQRLRDAKERGDRAAQASLLLVGSCYELWLAQDDPRQATAELEALRAQWPAKRFPGLQFATAFALAQADLYTGPPERAWRHFSGGVTTMIRALVREIQILRITYRHLRARAALALAVHDAGRRSTLIKVAAADARALRREREPWADGLAALIQAALASIDGQRDRAVAELAAAETCLAGAHMSLYAQTARWLRGQLTTGAEAAELARSAETWMASQGVRRTERVIATYGTGVLVL
jgi:eukaryotic-like serine/threonine-protein kinase